MMRSHSQNIFIQIDEAGLRKEKIEILESFCQPEALHLIGSGRVQVADIVDASVCMFRPRHRFDILKHPPPGILQRLVSSNPVQDEY